MTGEQIIYDPQPMLNAEDAFYMGQLYALGFAMPSDSILRTEARQVTLDEIGSDLVQGQMDRMADIANTLEPAKIGIFGGLAFNQMRLNGGLHLPLDIMLVPTGSLLAPNEVKGKYGRFQFLINATFQLPERTLSMLWERTKEGCSSSAITSSVNYRANEIYDLRARNRFGEPVAIDVVRGFPAISAQHEENHLRKIRAADRRGVIRNLIHREEVDGYRTGYTTETAHEWLRRQSDEGWHSTTHDQNYLLPTAELQDKFEEGRADVTNRGLAITA